MTHRISLIPLNSTTLDHNQKPHCHHGLGTDLDLEGAEAADLGSAALRVGVDGEFCAGVAAVRRQRLDPSRVGHVEVGRWSCGTLLRWHTTESWRTSA